MVVGAAHNEAAALQHCLVLIGVRSIVARGEVVGLRHLSDVLAGLVGAANHWTVDLPLVE